MTMKKEISPEKLRKQKSDNAIVYQSLAALLLMGACLLGLHRLRHFYGTIGGMELLMPINGWIALGGFAAAIIAFVVTLTVKNRWVRTILPWVVGLGLLTGITGISMRISWTQGFPMLYFLCAAGFAQYIILLLYRWEFFLFSLSTAAAGGLFLNFHQGMGWNFSNIATLVCAVVILVGVALVTKYAGSNHGLLIIGKKRYLLFPAKSNPLIMYLVVILWLVCIGATLLLGSVFAYYCMFAAIAVELIGGVYYTFQLN